jgi:5-methylcytosine-specific restriction endonuclease McrA
MSTTTAAPPRSLRPALRRVRSYWFACQRGRVPVDNPLDALTSPLRLRVLRVGGRVAYETYLRSRAWRAFRAEMLTLADGTCAHCGVSEQTSMLLVLDVHHLSYDRLGWELPHDVVVLCRPCHEAEHAA